MSPITQSLINYWHRLPVESPDVRRLNLTATCDDVRSGRSAVSSLVPFALADVDDEIVSAATATYVECCANRAPERRHLAVEDTLEWIRRGLALNRGAVFSALLATGDAVVHERLAAQRLTLSAEELEVVCRQLPEAPLRSVVVFLREWAALVEGSDDPTLSRQRELVAGALDRCTPVTGRREASSSSRSVPASFTYCCVAPM